MSSVCELEPPLFQPGPKRPEVPGPSVARRVLQALERLAQTDEGDLRHLQRPGREMRLRVGDWRVRLTFESETHTIHVFRVLHRSQAYRE